jgi:hypothetical protein
MEKSKQQLRAIFGACRQLGITSEQRAELVSDITKGRTESCADITYQEANEFNRHLKTLLSRIKTPNPKFESEDRMRKKVLSCFHEMGYRKHGKLDMPRVNQTIEEKGYLKKPLNTYKYNELPTLVSQFEIIKKDYLKKSYEQ